MKHSFFSSSIAGCLLLFARALLAAEPDEPELRPLSTDRPDVTESAHTVDAGHFQAEIDAARYSRDEGESEISIAVSNLKIGVMPFWDMQLVLEPVIGVPDDPGFGDVTVRSKFNLFGNDEGALALALMPWIKFPTAGSRGNGEYEGGLIVPLNYDLPADFAGGFMLEGDYMADETGGGRHYELVSSLTFSHELYGDLSGFIEGIGVTSTETGADFALAIDGGPVLLVTPNLQLDAGMSVGVTEAAEDLGAFLGISGKI